MLPVIDYQFHNSNAVQLFLKCQNTCESEISTYNALIISDNEEKIYAKKGEELTANIVVYNGAI
jgi:hypothetical protein